MIQSIFALCALVLSASTASAATLLDAEAGARLTACVQGLLTDRASRAPAFGDLQFGEEWVCSKVVYFKTGDPESSAVQTLVFPVAEAELAYRFETNGAVAFNHAGLAKGGRDGKTDYQGFNQNGLSGMLGLPFGIQHGFFWDFVRVNARGELVSEQSISVRDLPYYVVSPGAPSALATDEHKVYAYSVCKTRTAIAAQPTLSCF